MRTEQVRTAAISSVPWDDSSRDDSKALQPSVYSAWSAVAQDSEESAGE